MIFQYTWQQVIDGSKTKTRRIALPAEYFFTTYQGYGQYVHDMTPPISQILEVYSPSGRLQWRVGKSYAVQPGRGKKAVARITLTSIHLERLQDITEEDARAEGFAPIGTGRNYISARMFFRETWIGIHSASGTRWEDNPLCWVLEFGLVKE